MYCITCGNEYDYNSKYNSGICDDCYCPECGEPISYCKCDDYNCSECGEPFSYCKCNDSNYDESCDY